MQEPKNKKKIMVIYCNKSLNYTIYRTRSKLDISRCSYQ